MSSQEEQNRLDIRALEVKFEFIQNALKEQHDLLRQLNDKLDAKVEKNTSTIAYLKGQIRIIAIILGAISAVVISLLIR
jgi:hypothetical protein